MPLPQGTLAKYREGGIVVGWWGSGGKVASGVERGELGQVKSGASSISKGKRPAQCPRRIVDQGEMKPAKPSKGGVHLTGGDPVVMEQFFQILQGHRTGGEKPEPKTIGFRKNLGPLPRDVSFLGKEN